MADFVVQCPEAVLSVWFGPLARSIVDETEKLRWLVLHLALRYSLDDERRERG